MMMLKLKKTSTSEGRRHNRQMVLRAIYSGLASNRAALAQSTALTKPTISDLVAELIDDGLVQEEGLGDSSESGGKRPRLLRFLPQAQQIIGISITPTYITGLLANLDRQIIAEHHLELPETAFDAVLPAIEALINGLFAQLDSPLLAVSVGISATIDDNGMIQYAPRFEWCDVPLADILSTKFNVPVYVSNSTELAARAQFKQYELKNSPRLATLLIGNSAGLGLVLGDSLYHIGNEIGYMRLSDKALDELLGWAAVQARAQALGMGKLASYLHLRHAVYHQDPAALQLSAELSLHTAQILAWVIALIRPTHITLAGAISNLGNPFLEQVIANLKLLVIPDLLKAIQFSVDETSANLVALGAVAKVTELELGLL